MEESNTKTFSKKNENIISLVDAIPLAKPLAVSIEISGACNFKCVCCPQSRKEFIDSGRAGHMQIETFDKIISDLKSWNGDKIKTLALSALGESLLNPNFTYMISQDFAPLCNHSMLTTNASLLNGERARAILESDLTYLKISIYSIDQKKHEEITSSKIDIKEIMENVASFKSKRDASGKGPSIYVKMIESESEKENKEFLSLFAPYADEASIETLMDWNSRESFAGKQYNQHNTCQVCPYPFYRMHISNNGTVTFCCADYMNELTYDNVNNNSLEKIWFAKELKEIQNNFLLRKQSSYPSCKNCTFMNTDRVYTSIDSLTSEIYLSRYAQRYEAKVQ